LGQEGSLRGTNEDGTGGAERLDWMYVGFLVEGRVCMMDRCDREGVLFWGRLSVSRRVMSHRTLSSFWD
jgi:hypothetical protein